MPDRVRISPGFFRRVDLLAVANPRANKVRIGLSIVFGAAALVGTVAAALKDTWSLVAIYLVGFAFVAWTGLLSIRAKRRVHETKAWLDEVSKGA